MKPKIKFNSIENAPLLRRFTVLFAVMSFLPFIVIVYMFLQLLWHNNLALDINKMFAVLLFSGMGLLAGFYGMRRSILKINALTHQATSTLLKGNQAEPDGNEITQLTRAFNVVTQNLEDNIKRLEQSKHTIQYVLSKLATGVASFQNIDTFMDLIVEITANALDARTCALMVLDEGGQQLYIRSASGIEDEFKNTRLSVGEEGPGWVAKYKKPLLVPALSNIDKQAKKELFMAPLLCAPMLYQDKLVGVLVVADKLDRKSFQEDELLLVSNLASQTAVSLENERLNQDAEKTYLETISALALAVEARDPYSRGHLDRVSQYSVKLAQKLGLDEELIKDIKDAAELHDVGKIGISDSVLKKPGSLNEEEMRIMREHPIIGEGIVKPVRSLSRLCSIIRHHHEFVDGSGYPDGLRGDQIPLGAKILSVTDSFDAITTDRPYRKALSFEIAKEELKRYIDSRYDRRVTEAFISIV
jgi:HD-GYP domain-containing protein (c-di-GMP phosphodiesterase class II)